MNSLAAPHASVSWLMLIDVTSLELQAQINPCASLREEDKQGHMCLQQQQRSTLDSIHADRPQGLSAFAIFKFWP